MRTLAEDLAEEAEQLRRRAVHATRPRGPLSMEEAAELCRRMAGEIPTPPKAPPHG